MNSFCSACLELYGVRGKLYFLEIRATVANDHKCVSNLYDLISTELRRNSSFLILTTYTHYILMQLHLL